MTRMFERLEAGETPIGTITIARGPEWVEIMADSGLDYVCIDLMMTAIDWSDAADMVRAALLYNVTPWMRLESFPWGPGGDSQAHLTKQVLRAQSLGVECVTASANTAEAVAAMLTVASDLHRRPWLGVHEDTDYESLQRSREAAREATWIFPLIESSEALDNLDDILALPGLKAIFLGMGDLTEILGHPSSYDHPEVQRLVSDIAVRAHGHGVKVIANHLSGRTPEQVSEGVQTMRDLGVDIHWVPYPTIVVRHFYTELGRHLADAGVRPADAAVAH